MARRGNLRALKKAVRANPNMSASAKIKALSTIQRELGRAGPKARGHRPHRGNLGMEGFKEASMATAKLASNPVHQVVEGYHVVNGLNKIRKWLRGRSR
jgi:hypothetical protein